MLLHDFSRNDKKRIRQINRFLKENYGFSLSFKTNGKQLQETKIATEKNIQCLKDKNITPKDKELAKHLLVQEGVDILLRSKKQKLDEYALSNPYLRVMDWLTEFVVNSIEVGDDEAEAIAAAMKEYRSSKYRFPDFEVEHDLKNRVSEKLPTIEDSYAVQEEQVDEISGAEFNRPGGAERAKAGADLLGKYGTDTSKLSLEPMDKSPQKDTGKTTFSDPKRVRKPMGRASFGPQGPGKTTFQREGKNMNAVKENYVKQLRNLLEAEVEQAEVLIAAKGFAQEIQDMIEKLGRLMNEDLSKVSDQMRQAYGDEAAAGFQGSMTAQFEQAIGTLKGTKESIDQAVSGLAGGGNDMMADPDMSMEPGMDMDGGMSMEPEMDDGMGDDMGMDDGMGDEFGGEELGAEDPLGRGQKESINNIRNKIVEMQAMLSQVKKRK